MYISNSHSKETIDPELERLLLAGNEAAMKQVFIMYYSRFHYFSYKMINNFVDAEDIVAEAFLNFWQNIQENKVAAGNLQAYLYRMLRNRCLNYLERKQMLEGRSGEVVEQFYGNIQQNMDHTALKTELFHRIKNNFSQLTPIQAKVMQLMYDEGLNVQEIADRLETTPNNVRNHKARALDRLKAILKGTLLILIIFLVIFLTSL